MAIVSWEYYHSLYDKVSEEEFDRWEKHAEDEVCAVIGMIRYIRITADTFGYQQLQDCICRVINQMAENEASGKGKGLASVSNDGYSESYAIQTEEQLHRELRSSITSWLSGTGLVGAY